METDSEIDPAAIIAAEVRPALALLIRAFDYADDSRIDRWQFALEMTELFAKGATLVDVRWLILRGFAEHGREITLPGDSERSFRPLVVTSFPSDTSLVLTAHGVQSLRIALHDGHNPSSCPSRNSPSPAVIAASTAQSSSTPEWDEVRRELRYHGAIIKRYRVPAPNQEAVLAAFQTLSWPDVIDDPLPVDGEHEPKQRLHVTIKSLNRNHLIPVIRFHGNGRQAHWAPVKQSPPDCI